MAHSTNINIVAVIESMEVDNPNPDKSAFPAKNQLEHHRWI